MPLERVCRCDGEGWDGCDPEQQERERRLAAIRKRAVATRAGLDLVNAPAGPSLLDAPPVRSLTAQPELLGLPASEPTGQLLGERTLYVRTGS
jgi:hypothetical protein